MKSIFEGSSGQVRWAGFVVEPELIDELRLGALPERVKNLEARNELAAELAALATTSMASQAVEDLISADSAPLDWQVGEAMAEVLLEREHGAYWPWNSASDLKTPRASLPGADLVGFALEDDGAVLLFGEVKSSNDANRPPGVVYGRSGLITQIENLTTRKDLVWSLLQWLHARCKTEPNRTYFEQASARYVNSGGTDYRVVGCLLRDIEPGESDLLNRGRALGSKFVAPLEGNLIAWYLPEPMSEWPSWAEGVTADA